MLSNVRQFGRAFATFWCSGFVAKLFTTLSLILMIGLIDAGPRYFRAIDAQYNLTGVTVHPIELPPVMAQYSPVSYREDFTRQLEQCVVRVRDSLIEMGLQKSSNAPAGFKMLALRPDLQISDTEQPLDSAEVLVFLDARLECGCEQLGNFHLVRFVINPVDFKVTVLRDEIVSWYAYLNKNMPNTGRV
jgi:hypothetical protein